MWSHYPKQNLFQTPVEVRVNGSDVLDPGALVLDISVEGALVLAWLLSS